VVGAADRARGGGGVTGRPLGFGDGGLEGIGALATATSGVGVGGVVGVRGVVVVQAEVGRSRKRGIA
jgi:hypothetical protein